MTTSETKWTPGPWRPSQFGFQVVTGDSWSTVCTLKDGAKWEDGRPDYQPEYDWQLQEANARLIAAAPALYAALDAIKERCLFVDDDGTVRVTDEPNIDDKLFEQICAALRSARVEG